MDIMMISVSYSVPCVCVCVCVCLHVCVFALGSHLLITVVLPRAPGVADRERHDDVAVGVDLLGRWTRLPVPDVGD